MVLLERAYPGGSFAVVRGNLLQEPVEAIVNAANGHLAHGGGVAAFISSAAGPGFQEESSRLARAQGPFPTGSAVATGAGRLAFKGVIHAVGPRLGEGNEQAKLVRALTSAFTVAGENGWDCVAFPAISSGIFAVPLDVCARAYRQAVEQWLAAEEPRLPGMLRLCLRDEPIIAAVRAEFER